MLKRIAHARVNEIGPALILMSVFDLHLQAPTFAVRRLRSLTSDL